MFNERASPYLQQLVQFTKKLWALKPLFLLLSIVVITSFILGAVTTTSSIPPMAKSILYSSKTFGETIRCTEKFDGIQCFNSRRTQLIEEARKAGLSKNSLNQLDYCFNKLTEKGNGLAMLLNIQNCYHQVDYINLYQITAAHGISYRLFERLVFFGCDLLMLLSHILHYSSNKRQVLELQEETRHSKVIYNNLSYRCSFLEKENDNLNLKLKSEIGNIQGRFNRGGNIRKELDRYHLRLLNIERNKGLLLTALRTSFDVNDNRITTFGPSRSIPPFKSQLYGAKVSIQNGLQEKEELGKTSKENLSETKDVGLNLSESKDVDLKSAKPEKSASEDKKQVVAKVRGLTFDLSDKIGKAKWRDYCQQSGPLSSFSSSPDQASSKTIDSNESSALICNLIIEPNPNISERFINQNPSKTKAEGVDSATKSENLKQLPFQKFDKSGKPYRRIFVPGEGWTSAKKLLVESKENQKVALNN